MVEASLVYPVIVAVVIFSVASMIWFYEGAATAAEMSMETRNAAGRASGTFLSEWGDLTHPDMQKGRSYCLEQKSGLLGTVMTAESRQHIAEKVLTGSRWEKRYTLSCQCFCEAEALWMRNAVRS